MSDESHIESGTSYSTPFVAGTAALTWAADTDLSPTGVEGCLSAARGGGPDGRFVNVAGAVRCGLGDPSNLAPLVNITIPAEDPFGFDSVTFVTLRAEASDYESGVLPIFWTSDVEGAIGYTDGGNLIYTPSGPGIRVITATAIDELGVEGSDTVTLAFNPAPPVVQILSPGFDVVQGLETDLIGRVANLGGFVPTQLCDTAVWVGFRENSIIFDDLTNCTNSWSFINIGDGHVELTMTVDGLSSTATQPFTVRSDGLLHVAIKSPPRDENLEVNLVHGVPVTLFATSNAELSGVSYTWTVSRVDNGTRTSLTEPPLVGQSVEFTPTGFSCGLTDILISVAGVDTAGRMDDAELTATVFRECGVP